MKIFKSALLGLALTLPAIGHALVIFNFADPVGDHTGSIDVTHMTFTIDETNGDYMIDLTADGANPFAGDFRININLFNVTRNEGFQDAFNDFSGLPATTALSLGGTDLNLTDWLDTDVVATTSLQGLGNPPGVSFFRASVADLPFQPVCVAEDIIGFDGCSAAAPEPGTIALLSIGLVGFGFIRRRMKA